MPTRKHLRAIILLPGMVLVVVAGETWETLYWHLIRTGTRRKNGKEWGIT